MSEKLALYQKVARQYQTKTGMEEVKKKESEPRQFHTLLPAKCNVVIEEVNKAQ